MNKMKIYKLKNSDSSNNMNLCKNNLTERGNDKGFIERIHYTND